MLPACSFSLARAIYTYTPKHKCETICGMPFRINISCTWHSKYVPVTHARFIFHATLCIWVAMVAHLHFWHAPIPGGNEGIRHRWLALIFKTSHK